MLELLDPWSRAASLIVLLCAASGCGLAEAEAEAAEAAAELVGPASSQAEATRQPTARAGLAGPPSGLIKLPADQRRVQATVIEVLGAGSYHYLGLRLPDGDTRWAVVANGRPELGAEVQLDAYGLRTNFYSTRLDRSFSELWFAALVQP